LRLRFGGFPVDIARYTNLLTYLLISKPTAQANWLGTQGRRPPSAARHSSLTMKVSSDLIVGQSVSVSVENKVELSAVLLGIRSRVRPNDNQQSSTTTQVFNTHDVASSVYSG